MFLHAFVECINVVVSVSRSHCGDSADYAFCENVEGWPVARPLVSFFPENQDWQLHLSFLSLPVLTPPPHCCFQCCRSTLRAYLATRTWATTAQWPSIVDGKDFQYHQKEIVKKGNVRRSGWCRPGWGRGMKCVCVTETSARDGCL